jgi:hypothetical protein
MKKVFQIYPTILAAIILLLATGCKKEEPITLQGLSTKSSNVSTASKAPVVSTMDATNIYCYGSDWKATLNGTVDPKGLPTTVTFEYGVTELGLTLYATALQSPVTANSTINVTADISNITTGNTNHFRIKAENSEGTVYGNEMTFDTKITEKLITTPVSDITATTAIAGGRITGPPQTLVNCRVYYFYVFPAPGHPPRNLGVVRYTSNSTVTNTGSFTIKLTGLLPSKSYRVIAVATDMMGRSYHAENVSFTTLSSGK